MKTLQRTWAIVLAAGDGTRLASLTTDEHGNSVPKQFCSLDGGSSLLHDAMQRARHVAPRERVCVIVADHHRRYWQSALRALPSSNVIVQPRNCGTANGVLLATLRILESDPLARIVFLPADHYVRDEAALAGALREAATLLTRTPDELLLLGIEPEEADPELGYILPGADSGEKLRGVRSFVEKPQLSVARQLVKQGALWNSFIFAAHGPTLLGMIRAACPENVERMETALARDVRIGARSTGLEEVYEDLPSVDFSRGVMQGAESLLRVITAPACGWSDLGTPRRVAEALKRFEPMTTRHPVLFAMPAFINLAAQHARLAMAG
ncbi:MAG: sugar phosphate nucleotidyltransferase [Pseudomonadota bacterium]